MHRTRLLCLIFIVIVSSGQLAFADSPFDVIIRGGTVYDGTGAEARIIDVAIRGDRIAGIGDFKNASAKDDDRRAGARGRARIHQHAFVVDRIAHRGWPFAKRDSPGRDHRDHGRRRIDGAGERSREEAHAAASRKTSNTRSNGTRWRSICAISKSAASPAMSPRLSARPRFARTSSASKTRQPTPEQLDQMRELVRKEMEAGALGIGTSLIYPPAFYAKTDELIELCKVAAKYQGKYISHMRSEGNQLLEALDELIRISREAEIPAEIYHIKAAGQPNWPKARSTAGANRSRAKGRTQNHGQHVHLHRGRHRTRCLSAAVDGRRRLSGAVQTAARSGDARENRSAK